MANLRSGRERALRSWGLPGPFAHRMWTPSSTLDVVLPPDELLLAIGSGRSYGDVGLNSGHGVISCRFLDRFVDFDPDTGILECEAGLTIDELVRVMLPRGWFPAVVPGTRFVTIGGAIANDVHGKNHHVAGSFGDHVMGLRLMTSDGRVRECSPLLNSDLFAATIGGLGLTGMILTARLQLRRVANGWMRVSARRFSGLSSFSELETNAIRGNEYSVAWLDCLSGPADRIRGVHFAADHLPQEELAGRSRFPERSSPRQLRVTPAISMVNRLSTRILNAGYWQRSRNQHMVQSLYPFFWPLDGLADWNRFYGPAGFFQFQCVVPHGAESDTIAALLRTCPLYRQVPAMAVLKRFADRPAPGVLSFARAGTTLALDFPNRGPETRRLLGELESISLTAGGAIYPAKDATISAAGFVASFPRLDQFTRHKDPQFSSSMWRRVTGAAE